MTAIKTNVPAQQRARAEEARRKAEDEADKATQKALLNDAALWERMADYEEKHPQPEQHLQSERHPHSEEKHPQSK